MDLYAGLTGEAKELVREHQNVVDRLPRTFLVNTLTELEKWPTLFEPERAYFRALLTEIAALNDSQYQGTFSELKSFESRTRCDRVSAKDPDTLQRDLLDHLQRGGAYSEWRRQIDKIFQRLGPAVEARLYGSDRKPRLVMILYGEGISIERDLLWKRFRSMGHRVPLRLEGAETSEPFLQSLFTGHATSGPAGGNQRAPRTLFDVLRQTQNFSALDTWIAEADDALHRLCERSAWSPVDGQGESNGNGVPSACATGLSYERLRSYREQLSEAIYNRVQKGVRGPLELAAYIKTLRFTPGAGAALYSDDLVMAFVRDVFLAGSGTLIINNTFVEWAAVQALKRVQPRMLVARFGVRDKMKPFSSLLLFSKPRPADQIPNLQDPLGSFVDVELLSYYIWLNAQEAAPYRDTTLYLLLADGVDEMLAVAPGSTKPASSGVAAATLPDVAATMAHWLGAELPGSPGKAIASLLT